MTLHLVGVFINVWCWTIHVGAGLAHPDNGTNQFLVKFWPFKKNIFLVQKAFLVNLSSFQQYIFQIQTNKHDTRTGSCGARVKGCSCTGRLSTRHFVSSFNSKTLYSFLFNCIFFLYDSPHTIIRYTYWSFLNFQISWNKISKKVSMQP